MAGRRVARIRPAATVLAPRVKDHDTQRALDELAKVIARQQAEVASAASTATSAAALSARVVTYTATGTEGADFSVPIGTTLTSADYAVAWAPAGIQNVPLIDLPNAPGDRTTTHFRVLVGGEPLAAGETLAFVIIPTS